MNKKLELLVAALVVMVMVSFPRFTMAGPPSSATATPSRILVVQYFTFQYQGNGISTHIVVTPTKFASASYSAYVPFPNLTLVGLAGGQGSTGCRDSSGQPVLTTFSFQTGRVTVNFTTAPVNGDVGSCWAQLVFAPA